MESMINSYLRDVSIYLKENSLLISEPKSTVPLLTPDKHQFQTHPDITLGDTQLPLERSPKILVVIMDPSLSFHKHCNYVISASYHVFVCGRYCKSRLVCVWLSDLDLSRHRPLLWGALLCDVLQCHLCIYGTALDLVHSFLQGRSQSVIIDGIQYELKQCASKINFRSHRVLFIHVPIGTILKYH